MQFPIQKNQRLELSIETYNAEGAGVARFQGVAVFVPGAMVGETVFAQIIKTQANYAVARLLDIIKGSERRISPPCPAYGRCGGCALQHMDRAEQRLFKQQRIYDCFLRIGHIDLGELPKLHDMDGAYRYRNKASFPVSAGADGTQIGLYAPRSHRIVDVDDCLLQHEEHASIIRTIRAWMEECRIPAYDEKSHRGTLRHVVTRRSENGSWLVCLVVANPPNHTDVLISRLTSVLPDISGIVLNHNKRPDNVILTDREQVLFGQPRLREALMGLEFSVSIQSFMQVNARQVEVLYGRALEFADLHGDETVVDAYCGMGSMTLLFAKQVRFVYGIDCVPSAIEDARLNAKRNGIANAAFQCGYAQEALPRIVKAESVEVLLLDPPRKGCDEAVLQCAASHNIPRIVYVSCNPATLARDAATLKESGYEIQRVEGVDMFGQTGHVETVVLMSHANP